MLCSLLVSAATKWPKKSGIASAVSVQWHQLCATGPIALYERTAHPTKTYAALQWFSWCSSGENWSEHSEVLQRQNICPPLQHFSPGHQCLLLGQLLHLTHLGQTLARKITCVPDCNCWVMGSVKLNLCRYWLCISSLSKLLVSGTNNVFTDANDIDITVA